MSEEKRSEATEEAAKTAEPADRGRATASRARNQTVMLSPELTGQVRQMISRPETSSGAPDPLSELLPPMSWDRPPQPAATTGNASPSPKSANSTPGATGPGGSGSKKSATELGSDFPNQAEISSENKRPTGRMNPRATTHFSQSSGSQATFSVNPNVNRATTSGAQLSVRPQGVKAEPAREARSRIIGFLISFDKNSLGEIFEVRAGRFLISSRATDAGDCILIDDETISPLHAIVRASDESKVQVLDQLSEFGTGVTRVGSTKEDEVAGSMVELNHGDIVRFGKRKFVMCIVPKVVESVISATS